MSACGDDQRWQTSPVVGLDVGPAALPLLVSLQRTKSRSGRQATLLGERTDVLGPEVGELHHPPAATPTARQSWFLTACGDGP